MLDAPTYVDHVRRAGSRLAAAGEGHTGDPVPSMPGVDVNGLLRHAAGFCVFAHQSLGSSGMPELEMPDDTDDGRAWFGQEHATLVEKLEASDFEAPNWSWGKVQQAKFWFRRAAQELAVHCWDGENATGEAAAIDPALAADGVDEFVDEFLGPHWAGVFGGEGETIHLHATDAAMTTGGEWLLRMLPDAIEVSREHGKGDVAARGSASDLLLFLWGRVPPSALEVFGDGALLERWQDRVKI